MVGGQNVPNLEDTSSFHREYELVDGSWPTGNSAGSQKAQLLIGRAKIISHPLSGLRKNS
jgi:hypothetical protein